MLQMLKKLKQQSKFTIMQTCAVTCTQCAPDFFNLDQLLSIDPQLVCGVKLFLGSSTGNLVVDNQQQIEEIFKNVTVPIALHCEVDQIIRDNEQRAKEKYGADVPFAEHGRIRSHKACWLSTQYAVELAKKYNTHIHILL